MRRNPFEELEDMIDRMSRQFEDNVGIDIPGVGGVPVDVADLAERYEVSADLPGYDAEDIDVTLSDGRLRIEAERETGLEAGDADYLYRERQRESASRTVRLPEPVEEGAVDATYDGGVLTISLPKADVDESGHRIEIG